MRVWKSAGVEKIPGLRREFTTPRAKCHGSAGGNRTHPDRRAKVSAVTALCRRRYLEQVRLAPRERDPLTGVLANDDKRPFILRLLEYPVCQRTREPLAGHP